jgi:hypothetical protein
MKRVSYGYFFMPKKFLISLITFLGLVAGIYAVEPGYNFAIRGGAGTDVTLGLGYGIGGRYYVKSSGGSLPGMEVGPDIFIHHSSETSTDGTHDYTETTDLRIFAIRINFLYNFNPGASGFYTLWGAGVAGVSMQWVETSPTDTSLGTAYGSGSKQDSSGTVGMAIFNVGMGVTFGNGFDLRMELPMMYLGGDVPMFIPTLTVMAGKSF